MSKTYLLTHVSNTEDCGVILFDKKTRKEISRTAFSKEKRIGKVSRMELTIEDDEVLYQFYEGSSRMPDPKARAFYSPKKYAEEKLPEDLYGRLGLPKYDWKNDAAPKIPYCDCVIYCLHARGFTKHKSSEVHARGTFQGVIEKIPYLKRLGITTLEFQPIYEFIEKKAMRETTGGSLGVGALNEKPLLNYWGYTRGFYFAPKADYAQGDPVTECKNMIRALHQEGMEAIFQIYFPNEFNPMEIPEILRYWVEEYHVDGFHLVGENLPADLIAKDPELSEIKLWYYQFDPEKIYGKREKPSEKNLGLLRDDFMYAVRRFLKGEEGLVPAMMQNIREIPLATGKINYLTSYWGFTLMDVVSYDFKHNEANGEDNHDGTDYNCSWNCGEEGVSRKKKIRSLRVQQIKNALTMLLFAQGTPRIFMGDEFGNTQRGNNNPYCQDNDVTWIDWSCAEKNKEILEFFQKLLRMRKANPILHPAKEAQMMDSISCGYPDLSFHGETAWRPQMENYSRQLGILYCGMYDDAAVGRDGSGAYAQKITPNEREELFYLGINMHWENHKMGLPRLPKGKTWVQLLTTCAETETRILEYDYAIIPPKTITIFVSRDETMQGEGKDDKEVMVTLLDDHEA